MKPLDLLTLLIVLASSRSSALSPCSQDRPLRRDHFVPFFESHRPANGCMSEHKTAKGFVIHVIRVNTTQKEALLTITESLSSTGTIIFLDSLHPIRWSLAFLGQGGVHRAVFLSKGSQLVRANAQLSSPQESFSDEVHTKNDVGFAQFVLEQYGAITTFSRVWEANRISIVLPQASLPPFCDVSRSEPNLAIQAYLLTTTPASGCFRPELAGAADTDLFVIDLNAIQGRSRESRAQEESGSSVILSLKPASNGRQRTPRNLTLVLRSDCVVHWKLQSEDLAGELTVITSNASSVEKLSLSPSQTLEVRHRDWPEPFDDLWQSVVDDVKANPVSYIKVGPANVMTLLVPPRTKRELNPAPTAFSVGSGGVMGIRQYADLIDKIEKTLTSQMTKLCDQDNTVVAFPRPVCDSYNITQMTLNDGHCKASPNETHWVLRTHSTSCGSVNRASGNRPHMTNNVFLQFSPHSQLYQLDVRIPFECFFKPGLPGFPGDSEGVDDEAPTDDVEMYGMTVTDATGRVILEKRTDSVRVDVGDRLHVKTDFETRSRILLAVERCWLGTSDDEQGRMLVRDGCPASVNVTMESTAGGTVNSAFSFDITADDQPSVFLFCLIGLCSPTKALTIGNIGMCTDPLTECSPQSGRDHFLPTAQQLTRRGPILLRRSSTPAPLADDSVVAAAESPGLHSAHVVLVGVTVEVAVIIAVASFAIGVGVTGAVCCVMHRKREPKNVRLRRTDSSAIVSGAAGEGSELQSMMASSASNQPNGIVHA